MSTELSNMAGQREKKLRELESANAYLQRRLDEALEITDSLIANIQKHGHYSVDSTIVFLNQIKQCAKEKD